MTSKNADCALSSAIFIFSYPLNTPTIKSLNATGSEIILRLPIVAKNREKYAKTHS